MAQPHWTTRTTSTLRRQRRRRRWRRQLSAQFDQHGGDAHVQLLDAQHLPPSATNVPPGGAATPFRRRRRQRSRLAAFHGEGEECTGRRGGGEDFCFFPSNTKSSSDLPVSPSPVRFSENATNRETSTSTSSSTL